MKSLGGPYGVHIFEYDTPAEAYWGVINEALQDPEHAPKFIHPVSQTNKFHLITAESVIITVNKPYDPAGALDLRLWTDFKYPTRWIKLLKDYIYPEDTQYLFSLLGGENGSKARQREPGFTTGTDRLRHTHGACMFGLSIHPWPTPTVVIHTRSTFFNPTGALDMSVGIAAVNLLVEELGWKPDKIRLKWHISQFQLSAFKILPLLAKRGVLDNIMDGKTRYTPGPEFFSVVPHYSQLGRKVHQHIQDFTNDKITKRLQLRRPLVRAAEIARGRVSGAYTPEEAFYADFPDEWVPEAYKRGFEYGGKLLTAPHGTHDDSDDWWGDDDDDGGDE